MLPINDRLADIESHLRRTAPEFLARMDGLAALLPDRPGDPTPLDDRAGRRTDPRCRPTGRTHCRGGRGNRDLPTAPPVRSTTNVPPVCRFSTAWMHVIVVLWAAGLVALGIGATSVQGTVFCLAVAALMVGVAEHHAIVALYRRIAAAI